MPRIQPALYSLRLETYGLAESAPPLATADDAARFVESVGICLLFPHPSIELPALALAADASRTQLWRWKDILPEEKRAYVGKLMQRRPTLIALDLLPALYRLSATALLKGDRYKLYSQRYISAEVNRLTGVLAAKGPLTTRDLRRATGLAAPEKRGSFRRALADAEASFLAVRAGTTRGQHPYTYCWDVFPRVWPNVIAQASELTTEQAGRQIVSRYLQTVHAATEVGLAELFGLNLPFVQYIARRLIDEGRLGQVTYDGKPHLASPALIQRSRQVITFSARPHASDESDAG